MMDYRTLDRVGVLTQKPSPMDRPDPPARVPVSAAWLAEQERKQAAYAEARRAKATRWEGMRQAEPAPEEAPPPSPA